LKRKGHICLMGVFFFFLCLTAYSSEDVKKPDEPIKPKEPSVKDPSGQEKKKKSRQKPIEFSITLSFSDGKTFSGALEFTNIFSIVLTPELSSETQLISISNLSLVEISKWGIGKIEEDYFLFQPILYRIYTNQDVSNYILYDGNIGFLNTLTVKNKNTKTNFNTIFYDRWIEGKKGAFRWENSKSLVFPYNFDHPLPGVVTRIYFERKE